MEATTYRPNLIGRRGALAALGGALLSCSGGSTRAPEPTEKTYSDPTKEDPFERAEKPTNDEIIEAYDFVAKLAAPKIREDAISFMEQSGYSDPSFINSDTYLRIVDQALRGLSDQRPEFQSALYAIQHETSQETLRAAVSYESLPVLLLAERRGENLYFKDGVWSNDSPSVVKFKDSKLVLDPEVERLNAANVFQVVEYGLEDTILIPNPKVYKPDENIGESVMFRNGWVPADYLSREMGEGTRAAVQGVIDSIQTLSDEVGTFKTEHVVTDMTSEDISDLLYGDSSIDYSGRIHRALGATKAPRNVGEGIEYSPETFDIAVERLATKKAELEQLLKSN